MSVAACDPVVPTPSTPDGSAQPSRGVTGEQLAWWVRFREVYGLQADEEWVRAVESDPEASSSQFGVPLLSFERAMVGEARSSAQSLIPSAQRYGAKYPSFAGLWLEGTTLILAFAVDADDHKDELVRLFGSKVAVRAVRYSLLDLRRFARQLHADDAWFNSIDVDVIDVSVNEMLNGVNLYYRAPSEDIEGDIRERFDAHDWLVPEWAGAPHWTGPWGGLELTVVNTDGEPVEATFILHPLHPGGTGFGPGFLENGKFVNLGMAAVDWLVEINYVVDGVDRKVHKAFTVPADDIVKVHVVLED